MEKFVYAVPALIWCVIGWAVMRWLGRLRWWAAILLVGLAPVVTFYPAMIYGARVATCTGFDCGSLVFVATLLFGWAMASAALVGAAVGAALGLWRPRA